MRSLTAVPHPPRVKSDTPPHPSEPSGGKTQHRLVRPDRTRVSHRHRLALPKEATAQHEERGPRGSNGEH